MSRTKGIVTVVALAVIVVVSACAYARSTHSSLASAFTDGLRSARAATLAQPSPLPSSSGPIFLPNPPATMSASVEPLGVSPDGLSRWLVRTRFADAAGAPTTLARGGDIAVDVSAGTTQWQTRLRFGGPATIVSTPIDATIAVRVSANVGVPLQAQSLTLRTSDDSGPHVVAKALGPHLVQIGWFPRASDVTVRISRDGKPFALVDGAASTYRDTSVKPGLTYHYDIAIPGREHASADVPVPTEAPHAPLAALGGTGAWLSFSPSLLDADSYASLDPKAIVDRALASGLQSIQLRVAYGALNDITPDARPTIDALLDEAASRKLAIVAWTVPRARNFEDVATAVAATQYRTAAGNGFAGLAVDLERGDEFLGSGPDGFAALSQYLGDVRAALGRKYPLIATVEDPYLEHLDGAKYPYAAIARSADVLQPMSYWRMLSKKAVTPDAVALALRGSYATLAREAGRVLPIDIGGQTSSEGPRGAPPGAELVAAVRTARSLGAFGITFFDWGGTSDAQWSALASEHW